MGNPALGLEGKSTLVVGGGYGIGRETALLLGEAGANVAVADIDQARADAVRDEVKALGVNAFGLSADVTEHDEAVGLVDAAHAQLGGLDAVVNIVGMASWSTIIDADLETWDLDLRMNLLHHLYIGRAAAKHMIADGTKGAMSFVASVSGIYGAPNHAAYGAAKAGTMSLARSMTNEWGRHGIRVNCVAPDVIATPRLTEGRTEEDFRAMDEHTAGDGVPLPRMGWPKEIAGPLVFLVSELSSFMSGQTLIVDGGTNAGFPGTGVRAPDFNPADHQ